MDRALFAVIFGTLLIAAGIIYRRELWDMIVKLGRNVRQYGVGQLAVLGLGLVLAAVGVWILQTFARLQEPTAVIVAAVAVFLLFAGIDLAKRLRRKK